MAESEDDAFAGPSAVTTLAKYSVPRSTTTSTPTRNTSTDTGGLFSVAELDALMRTWTVSRRTSGIISRNPFQIRTKPRAKIHDLPTEVGLLVFEFLEGYQDTLKTARLVCTRFSELASPVLFKSVLFDDNDIGRDGVRELRQRPWRFMSTESLTILCESSDDRFCLPRLSVQYLKISTLKLRDHRWLLKMPILLPVGSHCLTTLYIDTRKLREYSNTQALGFRSDTLKSFCKACDLRGLRSLTVTNAGFKERRDRGHDVLSILRFCHLERLQYLELNFLTTYPRYLVDLLRACDWSVLRFVSIYRPQWNDKEMDNVPLWETLFDIEADGRIKIDYTEQLRIGKNYSEADIQFMVDNDIVPPVVAAYGEINRGFYKVLDDYVDREERKKNVLVPTQNPRHSDLALPLLPKPQSTTTRPYTPTPADEVQATTIIPLSPDLAKDTQLTPLRPQSPHRAELVTKSPEARILPAWKPSAPTYIPLKPHKFYSPLLSSCIVPNYKTSSLLPPSTPSTSYKVKESTYSPASPDWQSELFPT